MRWFFIALLFLALVVMNLFGTPWFVVIAVLLSFGAGFTFAGRNLYEPSGG